MPRWTLVDQPVTRTDRRRVEYSARKADHEDRVGWLDFLGVIGLAALVLAAVAALVGGTP